MQITCYEIDHPRYGERAVVGSLAAARDVAVMVASVDPHWFGSLTSARDLVVSLAEADQTADLTETAAGTLIDDTGDEIGVVYTLTATDEPTVRATVDRAAVEALWRRAREHRDYAQVTLCEIALGRWDALALDVDRAAWQRAAWAECARVITEARQQGVDG